MTPNIPDGEWREALTGLEQKLDRVALENKQLKRLIYSLFIVAGCSLLLAAQTEPKKKEIEANQFILLDDAGKARAKLYMDEAKAKFVLFDEKHAERVVLGVNKQNSGIALVNPDGVPVVSLGQVGSGESGLLLRTGNDKSGLTVQLAKEGFRFQVKDRAGQRRFDIGVDDKQNLIEFRDNKEVPRMVGGIFAPDEVAVCILDTKAKIRGLFGVNGTGYGVGFSSDKGKPRIRFGLHLNNDPYLHLLDEEGDAIFKAPK